MTYKRIYLYSLLTLGLVSCSKDNPQPAPFDLGGLSVGGVSLITANSTSDSIGLETPLVFEKEPPKDSVEVTTSSSCISSSGKKSIAKRSRPFSEMRHFEMLPHELFFNENFERQGGVDTFACSLVVTAQSKDGTIYKAMEATQLLPDRGTPVNSEFFLRRADKIIPSKEIYNSRQVINLGVEELFYFSIKLSPSTTSTKLFCDGGVAQTFINPNNVRLSDLNFPQPLTPKTRSRLCRIVAVDNKNLVTGVSQYFRFNEKTPNIKQSYSFEPKPYRQVDDNGRILDPKVSFGTIKIENNTSEDFKFRLPDDRRFKATLFDSNLLWREEVFLAAQVDVVSQGIPVPQTMSYSLPAHSSRDIHIEFDISPYCGGENLYNVAFNFPDLTNNFIEFFTLHDEVVFKDFLIHVERWIIPYARTERKAVENVNVESIAVRNPAQCSVPYAPGIH